MGTLGFEVERQFNKKTRTSGSRRHHDERGASVVAERGGKVRRRLSDTTARVLYAQASHSQQEQQGHGYGVSDDSRMADTRQYARRPHSAKLLRPSSRNLGRPTSASSARCSENTNRAYFSGNKDMDVLLEICRDQGRAGSLDPADFDSRYVHSSTAVSPAPSRSYLSHNTRANVDVCQSCTTYNRVRHATGVYEAGQSV